MTDRVTGYSKGFGFVRYATLEEAAKGVEGMHGKVSLTTRENAKDCMLENLRLYTCSIF